MSDAQIQARNLMDRALAAQMRGEVIEAMALYTEAIELQPSAAAHTFRGWAYSCLGDYDQAIEECLRAIELDPAFANPYNDIGAYLIEQGWLDAAIPWLEKASTLPGYDHPYFPWFNLGRVYERKRELDRAQAHYLKALACQKDYAPALLALRRLRSRWN